MNKGQPTYPSIINNPGYGETWTQSLLIRDVESIPLSQPASQLSQSHAVHSLFLQWHVTVAEGTT